MIVSVITCTRPGGVDYLPGTLEAVDRELGAFSRLLVCDGCEPPERDGWARALIPKRHEAVPDNKHPGAVALWAAYAAGTDLLFLEDDVRPVRVGALAELAWRVPVEGAAFVSFYHPARNPGVYRAGVFDRSQAVFFPAKTVERLWKAKRRNPGNWGALIGFDLAVASLAAGEGMSFEQAENAVEHVGLVSAAAPGCTRAESVWPRTSS